jgi:hypothetical protein
MDQSRMDVLRFSGFKVIIVLQDIQLQDKGNLFDLGFKIKKRHDGQIAD